MAAPTVLSAANAGGAAAIIPGLPYQAGLNILIVVTEAQNLPTTTTDYVNHPSSAWTCFVGTKGGAGESIAGGALYLYAFWRRHTGTDINSTIGDSGNMQVGQHIWVFGAAPTGAPIEAVSFGSSTSDAGSVFTVPGITTLGADRLAIFGALPRVDNTSEMYGTGTWANGNLAGVTTLPAFNTTASGGAGVGFGYGTLAAAGATGSSVVDSSRGGFASAPYGYLSFAVLPDPASLNRLRYKSGGTFASKTVKYKSGGVFAVKPLKVKVAGAFV